VSSTINRSAVLWAVGVLQPVSASELSCYLATVLAESGGVPTAVELQHFLIEAADVHQIVRVHRDPDLFSLGVHANYYMTRDQRLRRDRERIFLLRDTWGDKRSSLLEGDYAGLGGVSPPQLNRVWIQGSGSNKPDPVVPRARSYWPRIARQLAETTGPFLPSGSTTLDLLSFGTVQQLGIARRDGEVVLDFTNLALMIGISPRLITQMAVRPERHYRTFTIEKKSGSGRTINAPRVFLKVVQKFIADYLLCDLVVHDAAHAYIAGRSNITNAAVHRGASWIGSVDVTDFFGSITSRNIERLLVAQGFTAQAARTIRHLCSFEGCLPQGAPSSPILSNAFLFDSDVAIARYAALRGVSYSRYADDITVSGENKIGICEVIEFTVRTLRLLNKLDINPAKTRISGPGSRKIVTGVIVSNVLLPSRKLRRQIRAAAYSASMLENPDLLQVTKLSGYASYFDAFPDFKDNVERDRLSGFIREARGKVREHRLRELSHTGL
jgi:retron-type reverse transcriptase